MKEFDEIPFVPCNDCTSWESCTQDAYEQGKADAKAEHDKECDTCLFSSRKEMIKKVREEAIDEFCDALGAELTWRLNTGDLFIVKRVAKAVQEKLKEKKE